MASRERSEEQKEIGGNIQGLKKSLMQALEGLYDFEIPQDMLWTQELVASISRLSGAMNREIAVYYDRKGRIIDVRVGDSATVGLDAVEGKRSPARLSGIRLIHTHPGGSGRLSEPDISSLKLLRLDMIAAVGVQGDSPGEIYTGVLSSEDAEKVDIFGPYRAEKSDFGDILAHIADADRSLRNRPKTSASIRERAVLVGVKTPETPMIRGVSEADISMEELSELADTAGAEAVARVIQAREGRDAAYLVGKGKVSELGLLVQSEGADMVIFDEELSPSQQRNIEEMLGVKVLDRTGLILDIFAQRARSREGKIQVELAQLEYMLPRLAGQGIALSRLGGGIGTRGPGETKLETDRRHIRRKITYLKEQLRQIKKQRGVLRTERIRNRIPTVSLVGYTNVGKSSLLNALCDADVYAENKLFATLDTTTRRLDLGESQILLTDTVGFIRKLPHHLMDAFKSTLEEAVFSDALIIVADASDPLAEDHIRIVDEILAELGASGKPTIIAYNKIDRLAERNIAPKTDRVCVEVSARTHEGLDQLKACLKDMLGCTVKRYRLRIPFHKGDVISWVYAHGRVLSTEYDERAACMDVELDKASAERVLDYVEEVRNIGASPCEG